MNHLEKIWPAFLGSLLAMRWLNGSKGAKVVMLFGSVGLAWIFGPWVSQTTGVPESVIGVTIGLFGIAIVDAIFRMWEELNLSALIHDYVRKKLGLRNDD